MFAGSMFLFLTADILQEYANTKISVFGVATNMRYVYFDKVSPPPQKKKIVESSEQSSKYEQEQRKRAFLPSWQQN